MSVVTIPARDLQPRDVIRPFFTQRGPCVVESVVVGRTIVALADRGNLRYLPDSTLVVERAS